MLIHLGDGPQRTCIRCGRTLIRKTSLLHKIDPTALRSSFADSSGISHQMPVIRKRFRLPTTDPRIGVSAQPVTSRHGQRLDRSPLHDVRQHARVDSRLSTDHMSRAREFRIFTNELLQLAAAMIAKVLDHNRLVEPDGIEPTTSCLQSRRSPN
jgi:hypothetical protein